MALSSDLERPDALPRPQYFITRIIGGEGLPDYDFITLPADRSLKSYTREDVEAWKKSRGSDYPYFLVEIPDPREFFEAFIGILAAGASDAWRPGVPIQREFLGLIEHAPEPFVALASDIYNSQPLPIMQSPLFGKTIAELTKVGGGGAIFYQIFPHPGIGDVIVFFVLLGGIRIVLGASDGVATALNQGLHHKLLKWMGVPTETRPPRKKGDK